jgi:hypothetical protein
MDLFEKITETYKARMTVGLALLLGMITLTGYAISSKQPFFFLCASFVPAFAFFIDFMLIYRVAVPFAYLAFIVDNKTDNNESIGAMFLGYGNKRQLKLNEIKSMDPGIARQKKFRSYYIARMFWQRLLVYVFGSLLEILLWFASFELPIHF